MEQSFFYKNVFSMPSVFDGEFICSLFERKIFFKVRLLASFPLVRQLISLTLFPVLLHAAVFTYLFAQRYFSFNFAAFLIIFFFAAIQFVRKEFFIKSPAATMTTSITSEV